MTNVSAGLAKLKTLAVAILSTVRIFLNDVALDIVGLNLRAECPLAIVTRNTLRAADLTTVLGCLATVVAVLVVPTFVVSTTVFVPSVRLEALVA